jgi:hypothetical protein
MKLSIIGFQIVLITIWLGPYHQDSTKTTNPAVENKPSVGTDYIITTIKTDENKKTIQSSVPVKPLAEPTNMYPVSGFLGALLFEPFFLMPIKTEEES